MKKVAVVLCGAGHRDGSEIRESVFTLMALDRNDVEFQCFSIDDKQHHVNNHLSGEEVAESRNMLVEAARIARGQIQDLAGITVSDFDGLAFPGGFGAAFNLCNYATAGAEAEVRPVVQETIREFHAQGKPICAVCIAPALIAAAFRGTDVHPLLTSGAEGPTGKDIEAMGGRHQAAVVTDAVVDAENKITSAPAYMDGGARIGDVATGIEKAVAAFAKML